MAFHLKGYKNPWARVKVSVQADFQVRNLESRKIRKIYTPKNFPNYEQSGFSKCAYHDDVMGPCF